MPLIKRLFGWFFTYPPYRELTAKQSEAVVALLALALHADGEPHPNEREELERELTGVPHYWADEAALRAIVDDYVTRLQTEDFADLVREIAPRLDRLRADFVLTGAAFICRSDHEFTAIERDNLTSLGRLLGLEDAVIDRIVLDPKGHSDAMFAS